MISCFGRLLDFPHLICICSLFCTIILTATIILPTSATSFLWNVGFVKFPPQENLSHTFFVYPIVETGTEKQCHFMEWNPSGSRGTLSIKRAHFLTFSFFRYTFSCVSDFFLPACLFTSHLQGMMCKNRIFYPESQWIPPIMVQHVSWFLHHILSAECKQNVSH